jgi:hypothetical protein
MIKHRKKLITIATLSVVLVATIIVGVTMAFLSAKTPAVTNEFTFATSAPPALSAVIEEPSWLAANAENLSAGAVVDKDPLVLNNSTEDLDEWIALRVTYLDNAGVELTGQDLTDLLDIITIDFDTTGAWTYDATSDAYLYNTLVPQNGQTIPLFTTVTINAGATQQQLDDIAGFQIKLAGFAAGTADEADLSGASDMLLFADFEAWAQAGNLQFN